jgi:hypothetical protein
MFPTRLFGNNEQQQAEQSKTRRGIDVEEVPRLFYVTDSTAM